MWAPDAEADGAADMNLQSPTITVPLYTDEYGAIRIGETRILLELVIHAYYEGETPEGIVERYPGLTIADAYAVVGYYLSNPAQIDAYVQQRDVLADALVRSLRANLTPDARALRARLRALRSDAPPET
jgi:uncharacterized protein (DUF433 family)